MGLEFLDNCKLGVLQMVVVRTCTTMAAAVSLARESRHQEESRKFFQGLESSLTTLTLRPSFALLLLLLLAAATAIVLAVLLPPLPLLTRCATTAGPLARAPSTPIAASSGSRSPTHAPPASPSTRSSCSTGHAARKWLGPSPWPSFLPSRLRPPPNSSCGPRQGRFLLKKDCFASPTFPLMASLNTPNTWQAIVFLSFWQGVVLHGLVDRGVITGYGGGHDGATERARAVKDMLVCAEVSPSLPPTFSFLHNLEGKLVITNFFYFLYLFVPTVLPTARRCSVLRSHTYIFFPFRRWTAFTRVQSAEVRRISAAGRKGQMSGPLDGPQGTLE